MLKPIDIKDMPGYNPIVKNGVDSASKGLVTLEDLGPGIYPCCNKHKSLLKVSKDGIWRCGELGCSNGCYWPN